MARQDKFNDVAWGTDGVVSMPQAMPSTDVAMVDMEGFCFTAEGLRVNISAAEREDIIISGYGPGVSDHG